MKDRSYTYIATEEDLVSEWSRRFASFEASEKFARGFVSANPGKRVWIMHEAVVIAKVVMAGDGKVWTDILDGRYPLARSA